MVEDLWDQRPMIMWIIVQQTAIPFLSHYGHSLPLCPTDTGLDHDTCSGQWNLAVRWNRDSRCAPITQQFGLAHAFHRCTTMRTCFGKPLLCQPRSQNKHSWSRPEASTKPGTKATILLHRAKPPSLDQPNHSQPAQCEQKDKWGGFLCSNIVEIADQCKV